MNRYFIQEGNYLMHHGVLGMKWGVRRYQNADGSLTAAGRKKYGKQQYKTEKKMASSRLEKRYAKGKYLTEIKGQTVGKNRLKAVGKLVAVDVGTKLAVKAFLKKHGADITNMNFGDLISSRSGIDMAALGAASLAASGYSIGMLINTHRKNKAIKTYNNTNKLIARNEQARKMLEQR